MLAALKFDQLFGLSIDVSDHSTGTVLLQTDDGDVEHPIVYFYKKLYINQNNYSTKDNEKLALVLALKHFELHVTSAYQPLVVCAGHNPLVVLSKIKNKDIVELEIVVTSVQPRRKVHKGC